MKQAALPENEEARLAAVAAFKLLDADSSYVYSDFVQIASYIAKTPIALISLVDAEEQIFKSKKGLQALGTPREQSFCAHAILNPKETFIVEDATKDDRFADNPLVTGPLNIRFYCGVPLVTHDNFALGALCVIDDKPRSLSKDQEKALQALARRVMNRFEIHKSFLEFEKFLEETPSSSAMDEIEELTEKLGNLLLKKKDSDKR